MNYYIISLIGYYTPVLIQRHQHMGHYMSLKEAVDSSGDDFNKRFPQLEENWAIENIWSDVVTNHKVG